MYMMFKHLHATLAVLSIVFLLYRIFAGWANAENLNKKWLKIVPHAVDGLLVVSIIALLVSSGMHPFSSAFHTEKLLGFVCYIAFSVLAVLAIKGRFSAKLKTPFAALALISWFWLVRVAFLKQPLLLAMAG